MLTAEKVRAALEELSPTQAKVDLAVRTAVEIAQPSRVILFGSWPRGEAKWDSDLDMAVLLDDARESELVAIRRVLRRKLAEIPVSIDWCWRPRASRNNFAALSARPITRFFRMDT